MSLESNLFLVLRPHWLRRTVKTKIENEHGEVVPLSYFEHKQNYALVKCYG